MLLLLASFVLFFGRYASATSFIVANNEECALIGKTLMDRGATAPEVFIAISTCEGVVHPMDSGLGGGFQAVVYNESCGRSYYLNSREKSPKYWPKCGLGPIDHLENFIGVPSVLKGYEYLFTNKHCGYAPKLEWGDLFRPSMNLAYTGWKQSYTFRNIMEVFNFGDLFKVRNDDTIVNKRLGNFIREIIREGPRSSLYKIDGKLNKEIHADVSKINKFLTKSDIIGYNVTVGKPIECRFKGYRVLTTDLPGGGRLICLSLSVLDHVLQFSKSSKFLKTEMGQFVLMHELQRTILSMHNHLKQFSYSKLMNESRTIARAISRKLKRNKSWKFTDLDKYGNITLPMLERIPNPHGTTNVVVSINGVTIVATSTVNWSFGSQYYNRKYGFFYNNQLSDFNKLNPKHPNYCRQKSTPQSSISGTQFINSQGKTVFAVGAAGGKKILSSVFGVIFNYFVAGMNLQQAVDAPRCLVNLRHNNIVCEPNLSFVIQRDFHNYYPISKLDFAPEGGYSAITAATSLRGHNEAVFDKRRGGQGYVLHDTA